MHGDELNTDVTFSGNIKLGGAIAQINGRPNVGITANPLDDLIHNFNGAVYWFKAIQGGRSEGSGTRLMTLDTNGDLEVCGALTASNGIKEYDSGWFVVSALNIKTLSHTLGTTPKHVTVLCGESSNPSSPSIAGPFVINSSGTNERGAYVSKMTSTSLVVRAGNHIGVNEANDNWITSGYYRVIAWA